MASARLRASMVSFCLRSSAPWDSASLAIFSTSSLERPLELVMVIFCSLLVPRSLAVTLRMPLASISKVYRFRGQPGGQSQRRAGGHAQADVAGIAAGHHHAADRIFAGAGGFHRF